MFIIGCDYHPGFQQIAFVDTDTGELRERRLEHREQAEQFYRERKQQNLDVRVGMESSGHSRWFERLLHELGFELWIGDPAEIRTKRVRKQKTDRQDAQLILQLMLENRFPRVWVPDAENRDLRQLLCHRHRLVQMRTRVMNQLHVVPLNEGLRRKKALWRPAGRKELESIALAPCAVLSGEHYFYINDSGKPEYRDGVAKFFHIWLLKDGTWKMARAASYDHRDAAYENTRKEVTIHPKALEDYAGMYEAPKSGPLTVTRANNLLILVLGGERSLCCIPNQRTSFSPPIVTWVRVRENGDKSLQDRRPRTWCGGGGSEPK
jgi:hypothetical protein